MTKREIKELLRDFRLFAVRYLKIKDKKGNIIPLEINTAQEIVLTQIEKLISEGKPIRLIILKARQKGISTLIEAYIFWRTTYRKNRKSAVIGHERDATDNLWDMTNRYFNNLPEWLQPEKQYHNAKELTYKRTGSEMIFWTAEKGDVGSSHTVQDLHITELSKWRDPKTSLTALLQTVPDEPNTLVVMESTARGFGGEFYDRWQDAKNGNGNYVPIFLSWLIDDEYTIPFSTEEEKNKFKEQLDDIEKDLVKKGATLEHLCWRKKIGLPDKCGNDVDMFRQEYPSDDIEAFVTTGSPVFNVTICRENYMDAKEPKRGELYYEHDKEGKIIGARFEESKKGYIRIHSKMLPVLPTQNYRFAAGVDTAEGLAQGDYSVAKILDRRTKEVCLTWHGHIDPDLFSEELHKIQLYLNDNIFFCVESNNHGLTVINSAYKLGVKLYYREDFSKVAYQVPKDAYGFKTTAETKKFIINDLNEAIRERSFLDNEKDFWGECLTFVKNPKGTPSAQNKDRDPSTKCYDDRVMASALMWRCHLWLPNYYEDKEKDYPDWYYKEFPEHEEQTTPGGVMGI